MFSHAGVILFINTASNHSLSNMYWSYLDMLNIFNSHDRELIQNCFKKAPNHSSLNFLNIKSSSSHLPKLINSCTNADIIDTTVNAHVHRNVAAIDAAALLLHNSLWLLYTCFVHCITRSTCLSVKDHKQYTTLIFGLLRYAVGIADLYIGCVLPS
jgi:hypothetical protein